MNSRMTKIAGAAAAALLATTLAASAQGQTDTRGNAMGSQHVGNGGSMERGTMAPAPGTTTGAAGSMNGANHPTPSSTQGDVGPGGNNNGTRTGPAR
ncbi:hypothetical protein IP86_27405 [Rhodopseudomonas sp. AAP120]|jgi:hypothetical protein|uniref:hypothetical protein n=1 Tax=Rhodopseudomonas sp. AAP120 TaxID=1523430 RepID=UPI0006B9F68C|nr:hypothetical protein [Rhodopseudomonas sp. AAP120]KPF89440.1 hypothetical protein IP86_27405 [Rhodopseudomonas sp. AAP120]